MHPFYQLVVDLLVALICSISTCGNKTVELEASKQRLAEICGHTRAVDKIIGGNVATMGQFPWIARIGYDAPEDETGIAFRCGGSLISLNYVLTAAHCTHGFLEKMIRIVRLGEHNVETNPDCHNGVCAPPVQDIRVKDVINHKEYKRQSQKNDIALLRLSHPARVNEYVGPVCLPTPYVNRKNFMGKKVAAAGWGLVNATTMKVPTSLHYVSLKITQPKDCIDVYAYEFYETQICIGLGKGKDTCVGDSGGPITIPIGSEGGPPRVFQLGIVSYGAEVCGYTAAVYTNVSHYIPWIRQQMMS